MVGKNNHAQDLRDNLTTHYKAYKAGKHWVFASLASLTLGATILVSGNITSHADTTSAADSATTTTNDGSDSDSAALQSSSTATLSSSTASSTATDANTTGETTADSSSSAATDASTTTGTTSDSSTTGSTVTDSSSSTTDSNSSSANSTTTETDLGATDSATLAATKQAAAAAFSTTGQAQKITASLAETETADATIGSVTKTYDGSAVENFDVTLADGLTAPTGWYATSTTNQYEVPSSSTDLTTDASSVDAGTYNINLSDTGLARLQAANTSSTITTDNIVVGSLVINAATAPSNAIVVSGGSKPYDDNTATDPTSYTVTLSTGLNAPTTWTANSDASYTVPTSTGDIDAEITSQAVGSYIVTLSDQGIFDLQAVNPNYTITSASLTSGTFNITSSEQAIIGDQVIPVGGTLPTVYAVSINNASSYSVPSDWTSYSTNATTGTTVYTVPASYFDASSVDTATAGTYTVSFTSAAETTLNGLNSSNQLTATNVSPSTVTVSATAATAQIFYPANYITKVSNTSVENIYAVGSLVTLNLPLLNDNDSVTVNNLTEYLIVPSGFVIATADADGNGLVATDPASTVQSDIEATLTQYGVTSTGLTVTQEANYNDRQVFKIQFASVTANNGTVSTQSFPIDITVDPNTTVTSGAFSQYTTRDQSVLYLTDDPAQTQGDYVVNDLGVYTTVPEVANALGLTDAFAYDSSTGGQYVIVKSQVEDVYYLQNENGAIIDTVTTTGNPGDTYLTSSVVPTTVVNNGITYQLVTGSVPATNTYTLDTSTLSSASSTIIGGLYYVNYNQVVSAPGAITDQTMTWTGETPDSYTTTLPAGMVAPTSWTANGDGTYTLAADSADLNTSAVKADPGTYTISLSAQGLADLAAANTGYLFDNQVVTAGTLTITDAETKYTVTVQNDSGTVLSTTNQDLTYPTGTDANGVDISVANYPASDLKTITVTQSNGTVITYTANGDNSTTVTTTTADGTTTSQTLAVGITDASVLTPYGLGFGTTPSLDDAAKIAMAPYSSIVVTYGTLANPGNGGGTTNPSNPGDNNGNGNGGTTTPGGDNNGNGGTTTPGGGSDVTTTPGQPVVVPGNNGNGGKGSQTSNGKGGNPTTTTLGSGVSSNGGSGISTTTAQATGSEAMNAESGANNTQMTQNAAANADKLPQTNEQRSGAWAVAGVTLLGLLGLVGLGRKRRKQD